MLSQTCPKPKSLFKFKKFDTGDMELQVQISNEMLFGDGDSRLLVLELRIKLQEINHPGRHLRKETKGSEIISWKMLRSEDSDRGGEHVSLKRYLGTRRTQGGSTLRRGSVISKNHRQVSTDKD